MVGFGKFTIKKPAAKKPTVVNPDFSVRYKNPESAFREDIKILIAKGYTYQEIADELGRTKSAVASQVKRMGLQQRKGQ